jgi:hypothetical protein
MYTEDRGEVGQGHFGRRREKLVEETTMTTLEGKKAAALAKVIAAETQLAKVLDTNVEEHRSVLEARILLDEARDNARFLDGNPGYEVPGTERGSQLRAAVLSAVGHLTGHGMPFEGAKFSRFLNAGTDTSLHGANITLLDGTDITVWVQVREKNS